MEVGEALAAVRARFPELAIERASRLGGTDAPVFELAAASARYVFRFARTRAAVERTAGELRLLAAIRDRVPFAVPDHRYVTDDGAIAGHETLAGVHAPPSLANEQAIALRVRVAAMLEALRAVPVTVAWTSGLPTRTLQLAARWFQAQRDYERSRSRLPAEITAVCDRVVRATVIPPPYIGAMVVTHGSLARLTITIGDSIGFSNWSEACVADPALDLGALLLPFGGASGAGLPSEPLVERAVFVAKCTGLAMVANEGLPLPAKQWACRQIAG